MLIIALAVCALQGAVTRPPQQAVVRDSTRADSIDRFTRRRLPVTAEALATAFKDARARDLFTRARRARIAQDSALTSYDAKVVQRFSVKAGIGAIGPERLAFRQETAAHIRWQRDIGAYIEMTGARTAIPLLGSKALERNAAQGNVIEPEQSPLPYFPGSESLWIGGLGASADVDERAIVNMLAEGAEAYYTYESGDSASFDIGDGRVFRLLELKIRPRTPTWNVALGSLWFDVASGQLVRAAYRLSAPSPGAVSVTSDDTTAKGAKVASFLISSFLAPNTGQISSISVEYGLYEGRFWLPRLQSMEGYVQAMFARVPVQFDDAFSYASVNKPLGLAPIVLDSSHAEGLPLRRPPAGLDAAGRKRYVDSVNALYAAAQAAREDSVRRGMHTGSMRQCDTFNTRVIARRRYDTDVPVHLTVTCDLDKLAASPDLPGSIYRDADDRFSSKDRDKLLSEALSMAAQAPLSLLALPHPQLQFGPSMMRYNRVEGFSMGVRADQQLGAGLFATGIARYGFSDGKPNLEFALGRTNVATTIRLNAYTRLAAANDWGNPLSFGAGFGALFFGRDEGFYYRARGAEVTYANRGGARLELRGFTEYQSSAWQNTSRSVGGHFEPNIVSNTGQYTGASLRTQHLWGLDPARFRTAIDFRVEGAHGDSSYGRAGLDVTVSRGLFANLSAAVTIAGGSSVGNVPAQRRWFIGGTQTVRGERADTAHSGNAFWLGRAELARSLPGVRVSLFGDAGWTGQRERLGDRLKPMSGLGIGLSGFDGLIRFDVARGLYPREQTRIGLYLNARY